MIQRMLVLVMVAALALMLVPATATPASAHGRCRLDFWYPEKSADGERIIVRGRVSCERRHPSLALTMALQRRRSDGTWARVMRWRRTDEPARTVFLQRSPGCRPGRYRVRLWGRAEGAEHFHSGTVVTDKVTRIRRCG